MRKKETRYNEENKQTKKNFRDLGILCGCCSSCFSLLANSRLLNSAVIVVDKDFRPQ
jgi:hypothetical protein